MERIEGSSPQSKPSDDRSIPVAQSTSVLLIDDDRDLSFSVSKDLGARGYRITHAATTSEGLTKARGSAFDVLILDRVLGEEDGLALLRLLRRESMMQPVLILSALDGVDDRIIGLKAGGDDYLAKPFSVDELTARIEALLRRSSMNRSMLLQVGSLKMDLVQRRVWEAGREVDLLPREFKVLEYFMRRPGQIVTRKMLLEDLWDYHTIPETRLVDVHIGKLRRKIGGVGNPEMLLSIRNIGFILNAPRL